jgi:ApbE family
MNRRSFLKLTALLPAVDLSWSSSVDDYHFAYESVIGTSLDLIVRSPSVRVAEEVSRTIRDEIDRLASILDTRNPASEISRFESSHDHRGASRELTDVLRAYDYWERRTGGLLSIRSAGAHMPRNVDALGKAYIVERAAAAARQAWPAIEGLMLDVGGDIVVWGRSREIGIADPDACYDNGRPVTAISLRNAAVATSGTYARGAHLIDARHGQPIVTPVAATVVAGRRRGAANRIGRADANVGLYPARAAGQWANACRRTPACSHELAGWIPGHDQPSSHRWQIQEASLCSGVGGGLVEQADSSPGDLGREIEVQLDALDLLECRRRELPAVSTGHEGDAIRGELRPDLGRPRQRSQAGAAGLVPNHGRDQPGGWHLRQTNRRDRDQRQSREHHAARNHQLRRRRRAVRSGVAP